MCCQDSEGQLPADKQSSGRGLNRHAFDLTAITAVAWVRWTVCFIESCMCCATDILHEVLVVSWRTGLCTVFQFRETSCSRNSSFVSLDTLLGPGLILESFSCCKISGFQVFT